MEGQPSDAYPRLISRLAGGARLIEAQPLPGSFSNETTLLTLETAVDRQHVVVRRYAVFGSYDRGTKADREFRTLALCQEHDVPAPKPLLLDTSGALLGTPGIVTSFVPGRHIIRPADEAAWVAELAHTLARIHGIPLTAAELSFLLDGNEEVTWFLKGGKVTEAMAGHPDGVAVWHAVNDLWPSIEPAPAALMHVDFWTGNLLWQDRQLTAVLDWEEASFGDPGYDVAYLRLELAMLGTEALADAFLAAYVQESGRPVLNLAFWELAAAARFMPDPDGMIPEWQALQAGAYEATAIHQNFRTFLASALERAGVGMGKNRD